MDMTNRHITTIGNFVGRSPAVSPMPLSPMSMTINNNNNNEANKNKSNYLGNSLLPTSFPNTLSRNSQHKIDVIKILNK